MKADFLLVGRGLAGTTLALKLVHAGYSVISIDDPAISLSSRVAAGLVNPLVFRKITFSWRAQEALLAASRFYSEIQQKSETSFFHTRGMLRIFGSEFEASAWNSLLHQPEFAEHLEAPEPPHTHPAINAPFGSARVKTAGYLETGAYLEACVQILHERALVVEDVFNPAEVQFVQEGIRYRDFSAGAIILCEGWKAAESNWFGYLPFKPAKGEVLLVKAEGLPVIPFNGGVFGVPAGDSLYKIGATYEWGQSNDLPTDKQRADLEQRLSALIRVPFEVQRHEAGIRPTVSDRRPLIGRHPEIRQLYIFNGLGTRGALLAPLLADEMLDFLQNKQPLSDIYSISRFSKRHEAAN